MNSTTQLYTSANTALVAVLDAVGEHWQRPTPCEQWAVRDIVGHLIDAQRDFLAGRDIATGPAPDLEADPSGAWCRHAAVMLALLEDDVIVATPYDGHFGPTTVGESIEQFYVFDMVVHRWDIATAVGADARLTDAELDHITQAADGVGDALYADGICAPAIAAPDGADREARVLARLGRQA